MTGDLVVFLALVAVVAVGGLGLGLALAPRLSRWDERRSRAEDGDAEDDGGAEDRD